MRLLSITFGLILTVVASADPPCHVRQVVQPVQQVVHGSIHAATIYHDTHLRIVEVPVPAFVFQTLTAYQPVIQQQQVVVQQTEGVGTDDMLASLLAPSPLSDTPLTEIKQKCSACHSAQAGASKGGLTLFDETGAFKPTTSKTKGLTRAMIADRARSTGEDVMPPGASTNPAKRLSLAAIQYLETAN